LGIGDPALGGRAGGHDQRKRKDREEFACFAKHKISELWFSADVAGIAPRGRGRSSTAARERLPQPNGGHFRCGGPDLLAYKRSAPSGAAGQRGLALKFCRTEAAR